MNMEIKVKDINNINIKNTKNIINEFWGMYYQKMALFLMKENSIEIKSFCDLESIINNQKKYKLNKNSRDFINWFVTSGEQYIKQIIKSDKIPVQNREVINYFTNYAEKLETSNKWKNGIINSLYIYPKRIYHDLRSLKCL